MPTGFAAGSSIATPSGPMVIEHLRPGDLVLGPDRVPQHVRHVGLVAFSQTHLLRTPSARPIRLHAGALGRDLPSRDLLVAADTTMLVPGTGIAVAAWLLVNGLSVTREAPDAPVAYYHIERGTSAPVLAEGALCDLPARPTLGPVCLRVRARVAKLALVVPGPVQAMVDRCDQAGLSGWARDQATPGFPVAVEIMVNGAPVGYAVADRERPDLVQAGKGPCGFGFRFPDRLSLRSAQLISIRRGETGIPLGCPDIMLDGEPAVDLALAALAPDQLPALRRLLQDYELLAG